MGGEEVQYTEDGECIVVLIFLPHGVIQYTQTGNGLVTNVRRNFGYGRQIKIEHCGDYYSSYSHLYRYLVKEGDSVSLGQPIARAGNSGMVTGPHLHYEVLRGNKTTNPIEFMNTSLKSSVLLIGSK